MELCINFAYLAHFFSDFDTFQSNANLFSSLVQCSVHLYVDFGVLLLFCESLGSCCRIILKYCVQLLLDKI